MLQDVGATKRLKGLFSKLKQQLPAVLEEVGRVATVMAATRAPTPEVEYMTMMVGEGNPEGITNVPPFPGASSSGDSDADNYRRGQTRMRFYKPDGLWLQQVIATSMEASGLWVGVGNIAFLQTTSIYYWRNITGETFWTRFPFFECWETGIDNSFYIVPRQPGKKKQSTLKPGIGKENQRYFMHKTIPAYHMYGSIDLKALSEEFIKPAIRRIVKEA